MEPLRKHSHTLAHSSVAIYEIPFANQEEFESAWPHILKLKSKEAPVILLSGPHKKLAGTVNAGVRILSPVTGILVSAKGTRFFPRPDVPGLEAFISDHKFVKIGPPWPDHIKSESGALPKYVFNEDGKWAPHDPDANKESFRVRTRARIDIELVVDGDIVDLNRIPLPADTPMIDKRFKDRHN